MISVADLAKELNADYVGDGDTVLSKIASLQSAEFGDLCFLADEKYQQDLMTTQASAVLVKKEDASRCPSIAIICDDPYAAYAVAARIICPSDHPEVGIHQTAVIDGLAQVHETAWIGPGVVIEAGAQINANVQIGPGCVIGKEVVIGEASVIKANCTIVTGKIGKRVVMQPGVVVGSDGFGNVKIESGWKLIPQLGSVEIGDDVAIGANTTIDRGAIDATIIGNGVKIDNQVQIAHNVTIGDHTAIAGCVGIAGSARIGANCQLAGGVGIVGHLKIADDVIVTGMTMVTHSITRSGVYSSGTPLMENLQWRKNAVRMKGLDRIARSVHRLEKFDKNK